MYTIEKVSLGIGIPKKQMHVSKLWSIKVYNAPNTQFLFYVKLGQQKSVHDTKHNFISTYLQHERSSKRYRYFLFPSQLAWLLEGCHTRQVHNSSQKQSRTEKLQIRRSCRVFS